MNSPSPFDSTKFNLVSGGTVYNVDTTSTGLATMGQTTMPLAFLRRKPSKWWLVECYGVTDNADGQQLFPTFGTTCRRYRA